MHKDLRHNQQVETPLWDSCRSFNYKECSHTTIVKDQIPFLTSIIIANVTLDPNKKIMSDLRVMK